VKEFQDIVWKAREFVLQRGLQLDEFPLKVLSYLGVGILVICDNPTSSVIESLEAFLQGSHGGFHCLKLSTLCLLSGIQLLGLLHRGLQALFQEGFQTLHAFLKELDTSTCFVDALV